MITAPSPRAANGLLALETDSERLALSVFASLQGGLALMGMSDSIEPLRAALDGALDALHAHAPAAGLRPERDH